MPDYSKGKIYKIVNDVNDKVYYGSTIQKLCVRMCGHRAKHSNCMSKNIGVDLKECKIILVENIICNSKEELLKRERWYIENNECVNKRIPGRTKKEYRQANKEKIAKKRKQYNEKNKAKMSEKSKKYREKNKVKIVPKRAEKETCECGAVVAKCNMLRHKKTKKHQK